MNIYDDYISTVSYGTGIKYETTTYYDYIANYNLVYTSTYDVEKINYTCE